MTGPHSDHPPHDELTLDPTDWAAFRTLAHRMVDDMLTHLETLPQQSAWREMPPTVRQSFNEQLPKTGIGAAAAYEAFVQRVMPYTNGNIHPRFWGWVQSNGTPLGMMADMLAAGLNPHMAGFNQAPALVEEEVLRWLAEMVGMPATASGLLVQGGTMANVLGLVIARYVAARAAGFDVRTDGLQGKHPPLVFYASTEAHNWASKGAEWLGLGSRALRQVAVDQAFRLDVRALEQRLRGRSEEWPASLLHHRDGRHGQHRSDRRPRAIGGDRPRREAVVSRGRRLWRSGVPVRRASSAAQRSDPCRLDRLRSAQMGILAVRVRVRNDPGDHVAHQEALTSTASYLAPTARGVIAGGLPFANRGLELTRSFRALKVWMTLKAEGVDRWTKCIEQNVHHARHLARAIEASPELELLAPAPLNVVCFRYAPRSGTPADWDALNQEILVQLQERGIAVPSGTVINGRFAIRVANVNHRSKDADFDALLRAVIEIGRTTAG